MQLEISLWSTRVSNSIYNDVFAWINELQNVYQLINPEFDELSKSFIMYEILQNTAKGEIGKFCRLVSRLDKNKNWLDLIDTIKDRHSHGR